MKSTEPAKPIRLAIAALLTLSGAMLFPAPPAEAAARTDVTAAVLAGTNVTLAGPSIINLPSGTTTYRGVFSGHGTLTIAGSGTLILTKDSDFTLPSSEQAESLTRVGSPSYPVVTDPDQPAVIVEQGATLQYGDGGSTGVIGDYPYPTIGKVALNHDNIEIDGTLDVDLTNREFDLGTITGSGLFRMPRFVWNTPDLVGDIPFSGTISDGTQMNFGNVDYRLSLPSVTKIVNDGSAILNARGYTLVLPENFYEDHFGDDINFHTWQTGLIEMTGTDNYIDPSLDRTVLPHGTNYRGINIGAANVQWGNGTTDQFFLPALAAYSYIDMQGGSLTLDYDGPVTLDTRISGGILNESPGTPGTASITLAATAGNAVTFATPMNYHGTTTIGRGATLLLGTGVSGGDSSLLTGASNDQVVDDGTLTIRNTSTAITLANVSGTGGLTQSGSAATTLSGTTNYTGPTTISKGTLAITGHASTPSGTWRVRQGTLAVGAGGSLNIGSLIQSAGSTLSLIPGTGAASPTGAPIQVSGAVQLGGMLTVTSVPDIPANGTVTLVHDTGTQPIAGTFTGLPQGAHLTIGGKQYTIDYEGDSGHDVALSTGARTSAMAAASNSTRALANTVSSRDAGSGSGSTAEIAGAAGAGAVALAVGTVLFTKRRRRGPTEAAPIAGRAPAAPSGGRHRHGKSR
jgi:autotransporter-associated beta strand protein